MKMTWHLRKSLRSTPLTSHGPPRLGFDELSAACSFTAWGAPCLSGCVGFEVAQAEFYSDGVIVLA